MVAVLLSHLNPSVQRINVSGINGRDGDGGKHVQFVTREGLIVYQLESFTGRMRKGVVGGFSAHSSGRLH